MTDKIEIYEASVLKLERMIRLYRENGRLEEVNNI